MPEAPGIRRGREALQPKTAEDNKCTPKDLRAVRMSVHIWSLYIVTQIVIPDHCPRFIDGIPMQP